MDGRQLLFVSGYIPEKMYNKNVKDLRDQQTQKFDRLMIKGFLRNGFSVDCVSFLSGINGIDDELETDEEGCHFCVFTNSNRTNHWSVVKKSYKKTETYLQKYENAVVVCNVLNISMALGAVLAARKNGNRVVGFITDMPNFMFGEHSIHKVIDDFVISRCTDLIFLTEQMTRKYGKKNRKYSIMEGLADFSNLEKLEEGSSEKQIDASGPKVLMYAGSLHKCYGIEMLVKAFSRAEDADAELHIYGKGDFENELLQYAKDNKKIRYFGAVLNEQVVSAEKEADLLINPRTSEGEYTKYSFPSKVIEYMASGTPVLMNMLPGIPDEYRKYCYCFESETVDGYVNSLNHVLSMDLRTLRAMGEQAQEFVYAHKNYTAQIKKVLIDLDLEDK